MEVRGQHGARVGRKAKETLQEGRGQLALHFWDAQTHVRI